MSDTNHHDDDLQSGEQFPNPYLAASMLPPGRRRLEAVRQFLKEEMHRLDERLDEITNDDGSIPDDASDEWSMAKGRLDQTRVFYGLVVQGVLTDQLGREVDDGE